VFNLPKSIGFLCFALLLGPATGAHAQEEEIPPELQTVMVERTEVQTLLGEITQIGVPEEVAHRAFSDLVSLGAAATTELIDIYQSPTQDDHRRWVSARALGHIGGKAATQALLDGLRAPEFFVRIAAASGLGVLKGDEARMALEEALFDPSMEVKCTAADGLTEIGHTASSLPLARALNSPDSFHRGRSLPVRAHLVIALGRTGGETAIEALIGVLDDDDDSLRAMAIKALEEATGANPVGQAGNGVSTTSQERQAWMAWWEKHCSARSNE